MPKININAGLKTPNWVEGYCSSFNGCSGTAWRLSPQALSRVNDYYGSAFDRKEEVNLWDLLTRSASKKLTVLYTPAGARLPSPNNWYHPPAGFEAYYVKSDDDVLAIIGGQKFEHFSDPKSPPAIFLADPEKYASLAHLEHNGMYHRSQVINSKGSKGNGKKAMVRGHTHGDNQLRLESNGSYGAEVDELSKAWSSEICWLRNLPWWEKFRLADVPYPSAEECVAATVDGFLENPNCRKTYNGLAYTAGNAATNTPWDSIRNVFCFHSLNPESTFRLDSTPVVTSKEHRKAVYYKVLPFYFHSPLHRNHRVAACFLADRPIHLEKI